MFWEAALSGDGNSCRLDERLNRRNQSHAPNRTAALIAPFAAQEEKLRKPIEVVSIEDNEDETDDCDLVNGGM